MTWQSLFRKKSPHTQAQGLNQVLSAVDLTFLGIGAVIGAGIFILTGIVAATKAGPGIILSFVFAALACGCSALAYAELAASIGGCGSAYGYAYVGFGELVAWIVGWDLLLEYGISCSAVAIGWSSYINSFLVAFGVHMPVAWVKGPFEGGILNLPACFIILVITGLLILGVKQTARVNLFAVLIKLIVIALFLVVAAGHFDVTHWKPFLPFGMTGVVQGAAVIFFAYVGFDAVSTAAEETKNPQRNVPRGLISSLIICTAIYILVSGVLTGMISYTQLNVASPVAYALLYYQHNTTAAIVALGAVAGLTTVILVMYYGFTRVCLAMARDGLLPKVLSRINPNTHTPVPIILIVGMVMTVIAAVLPIHEAAELVNIGTLTAFTLVSAGVLILRYTNPDLDRPFKMPGHPWLPVVGILLSMYLMAHLSIVTWSRFFIWLFVGLVIYFGYGRKHSALAPKPD